MFVDAAHNKLTQRVASRVYNRDAMIMSDFFGHFLRIDYGCTAGGLFTALAADNVDC